MKKSSSIYEDLCDFLGIKDKDEKKILDTLEKDLKKEKDLFKFLTYFVLHFIINKTFNTPILKYNYDILIILNNLLQNLKTRNIIFKDKNNYFHTIQEILLIEPKFRSLINICFFEKNRIRKYILVLSQLCHQDCYIVLNLFCCLIKFHVNYL